MSAPDEVATQADVGNGSETARVLVVDDEPEIESLFRRRFRRELRADTLELWFARDGLEALQVLDEPHGIGVVLADLNMPRMDGLTLLSRLAEQPERLVKTVVITAYGDMSNIRNAMRLGAFDFQIKPLDFDDVRATINKAVVLVEELRRGRVAVDRAATLEAHSQRLRSMFDRYVSTAVVDEILENASGVSLDGERRRVTVVMADIRGFTAIAERTEAEVAMRIVNDYFSVASEIILARGGTINEILGDGLVVYFGAPMHHDDDADRAVAASIELQLALLDLNRRNRDEDLPEVAVGIGIHTGEVLVGTIGSADRAKYAAIGAPLNLTGRIEQAALGGEILVSEATLADLEAEVSLGETRSLRAKGIADPVTVHLVRGLGDPYGLQVLDQEVKLRSLPEPIPVTLARLDGKFVGEARFEGLLGDVSGSIVATTGQGARPAQLDDVEITPEGYEAFYGRVIDVVDDQDGWRTTIAVSSCPPATAVLLHA